MSDNKIQNDAVYGFVTYCNPNSRNKTKYLLFRGIGIVEDGVYKRIKKYDYLTSENGFTKLRNYYDMVDKFGNKPCVILDTDNNVISDVVYNSQDEIAKKYGIKISKLSSVSFSEKDTVRKRG